MAVFLVQGWMQEWKLVPVCSVWSVLSTSIAITIISLIGPCTEHKHLLMNIHEIIIAPNLKAKYIITYIMDNGQEAYKKGRWQATAKSNTTDITRSPIWRKAP